MYRVGIQLPAVEVRFKDLTVTANVSVGKRALPSLLNAYMGTAEVRLRSLHVLAGYVVVCL